MEILRQLFPDLTDTKLRNALTSSNDDVNLAGSILLSEARCHPTETEQHDELDALLNMFPSVPKVSIQQALDVAKGDIDEAIHDLLCINTLSLEERNSQQSNNDQAKSSQLPKDSDWNRMNENLKIIMTYGGVPRNVAQDLYIGHRFDPIWALIQLIFTYEDLVVKYRSSPPGSQQRTSDLMKSTGRVQSQTGFAHQRLRNNDSSSKIQTYVPREPSVFYQERSYKFDPSDSTGVELNELIQGDSKLRAINHKFMIKTLEYFNGEVAPTVSLAILIVERKYAKYTGKYTLNLGDKPLRTTSAVKQLKVHHVSPSTLVNRIEFKNARVKPLDVTTPTRFNQSQFRNLDHYHVGAKMIQNIMTNMTIDFHGWYPEDAQLVTAECLKKWWRQELSSRELNNQRWNQIQAMNVPDITVITGRGLHSAGGVPKVRNRIKKFLIDNNYNFIEESSLFIVNGKKRSAIP